MCLRQVLVGISLRPFFPAFDIMYTIPGTWHSDVGNVVSSPNMTKVRHWLAVRSFLCIVDYLIP